jgi:polynucleotide kinase-phosphatase
MTIRLPEQGLVLLVGSSGSGKSTFAKTHFLATEIVSSDACRGLVSDDENNQQCTDFAFELLQTLVSIRLRNRRFTVVDATNLRPEDRKSLRRLASDHDSLCTAVLFDTPRNVCKARNAGRPDRNFSHRVIDRHHSLFRQTCRHIKKEKFHRVFRVKLEDHENLKLERTKLWCDKREITGPFDIIGDLHGCAAELSLLLEKLGYENGVHPDGRTLLFVGDITDRGPRNVDCFKMVKNAVENHHGLCVCGNHDAKLKRYLEGRQVQIAHGLQQTVTEIEQLDDQQKEEMKTFLGSLISHYVLDGGKLVVAHAGIKEDYQGKASSRVRNFCMYGDTTGEVDEFGLPERLNWAADYRGDATVVYGHTPVSEATWLNRTINIDTGCVFGHQLTALRYPELELVAVDALETYAQARKPMDIVTRPRDPNEIQISDVMGKQILNTRLIPNITLGAEHTAAALEVISRFAVAPEWLVYLPPTMSPCSTSQREDYLEYPTEAFEFYLTRQHPMVICQEKHMGSRSVLYLKRDGSGRCLTRTGRPFFEPKLEKAMVESLVGTLESSRFWTDLSTDWVLIDAELMPWSAKAQALLEQQYAAVGAAAINSLPPAIECLKAAGPMAQEILTRQEKRLANALGFRQAYRTYCWSTDGIEGIKLAPFHLLATDGAAHVDKTHRWHLDQLQKYLADNPLFHPTKTLELDLRRPGSVEQGCQWWEELTSTGGEGMVVKPETFIAFGKRGLLQPALKVRGREYLRIIYGPDYTEHLDSLRQRAMSRKRSLALREFSLGVEALEKFVQNAPLYAIHRLAFGVMALESSPVDPRL